jgi:hypothetical protein
MNKTELLETLSFLFENNAVIGLELYLVLKTNNELELRKADLGEELQEELKKGFLQNIHERTFDNEDIQVLPLSELNSDRSTIHHYNLDGLPEGLEIINSELNPENIVNFNFNRDNLNNVKAFLIKLSSVDNQIVLYKNHSHLNILKQNKILYFIRDNERFTKPQEGILRFSFKFEFMKVNNQIMVYDIDCLEKEFRFENILINNAQSKIDDIKDLGFLENIDELRDFANERKGAKKVLSINLNSPVLKLEFNIIRQFVQNHPYLSKRLKFNDNESKFRFHTKASKIYFINLLNDNYLTSNLTSIYYQTNAKEEMKDEQEEQEN